MVERIHLDQEEGRQSPEQGHVVLCGKVGVELRLRGSINSRKLWYFVHINKRDESVEKLILQVSIEGRRGRGRPITSWTDDIKMINA